MATQRVVDIRALGVPTLTRPRGREAYRKLATLVDGLVLVELDGAKLLSLSFLDGLVLEALEARALHRLTFVTADARTRGTLSRVAALHPSLELHVQPGPTAPRRRVVPAAFADDDAPVFEGTKGGDGGSSTPPARAAKRY